MGLALQFADEECFSIWWLIATGTDIALGNGNGGASSYFTNSACPYIALRV